MLSTFFKPDHLRPYVGAGPEWFDRVLSEFEGFWDGESPRIGETGARGWRHAVLEPPVVSSQPAAVVTHVSLDPFERWLEAERHAEQHRSRPSRATDLDAADEDDPYRVVLFSDVRPFLWPIRSPEVRQQIIYAFLNFLGLPFTPPEVPTTAPSAVDPHLQWSLAYNTTLRSAFWPPKHSAKKVVWQTVGGEPMEPEHPRALQSPFTCPVKLWAQDRGTLFARSGKWFRDLEAADLEHVDVSLVRYVSCETLGRIC